MTIKYEYLLSTSTMMNTKFSLMKIDLRKKADSWPIQDDIGEQWTVQDDIGEQWTDGKVVGCPLDRRWVELPISVL